MANDEDEFDILAKSIVPKNTSSHNNFAGKYNPSYVLLKSNDGHVYAKYVGTSYGSDYHVSIDRKSTRLNSSHSGESRMPSSA